MHSSPEKSGATSTSRGRRGRKRTRRWPERESS
jgi:hypothetical protein